MRAGAFWRDQLPAVLLNVCGAVALALFLLAGGVAAGTVAFITGVWAVVLALWLGCRFILQKRRLDALLALAEQLDERYLLPEVLPPPATAEEEVYRQLMRMAEKSMLEKIGTAQRERAEYREYIEQWVHEIKTPITAGKLLCENHRSEWTRQLLAELESITRYTEQALYYARSEHTEKDYLVREIDLAEVVHAAVAGNKYLLRRHQVAVSVECETCVVCTDDKWVRFILDQLIGNAVKYGGPAPALRFSCRREEGAAVLLLPAPHLRQRIHRRKRPGRPRLHRPRALPLQAAVRQAGHRYPRPVPARAGHQCQSLLCRQRLRHRGAGLKGPALLSFL